MKTFTIDSDLNITAHASAEEEAANAMPPTGAHVFSNAAGLKGILKQFPAATAVDIWNGLTGVTPVKKFKDGTTAAKRIFTQLQTLGGHPDDATEAAPAPARSASKAPAKKAARSAAKSAKAPKPSGSGPRATSKTAQLIEMLRRSKGATLEEVMARFGWQIHTTRALMSAGGSLTKKHGIAVISEKVDDVRTYRIAR
jgi:hypothetical protein